VRIGFRPEETVVFIPNWYLRCNYQYLRLLVVIFDFGMQFGFTHPNSKFNRHETLHFPAGSAHPDDSLHR
jgi:hypothetical protein